MNQDSSKALSRSALHFFTGTLLSRASGLVRDIAMAFSFGSHPAIASFMVSYRFSNLMRRLFGEGTLSSGFVPPFEVRRADSQKKAALFFRDVFASLTIWLVLLILLLEGGLFLVMQGIGFSPIIFFTMLMLPGVLFICLFGLGNAFLQCEKKFFLSGVSPIAFNLVWISAVLMIKNFPIEEAVTLLSFAIVGAFFFQWMTTLPMSFRFLRAQLSWKEIFSIVPFSKEVRALFKPFLLSIIGVSAVQINTALDSLFAYFASEEGPAYLWYSSRIYQLPLALFGIALSSALLPSLARAFKQESIDQFQGMLRFALSRAYQWIFPCMIACVVGGCVSVNLLYGRGDFSPFATKETVLCLWGYAFGLIPTAFVLLFAQAFYAKHEFRIPMVGALLSVLLNTILNALMVFVFQWGSFSIAIATSLSALFNCLYLARRLTKKIAPIFDRGLLFSFGKTTLSSLIAGVGTMAMGYFFVQDPTFSLVCGSADIVFVRSFWDQLSQFAALFLVFSLLFLSYGWMVRDPAIMTLLRKKNL